jgi:2-polyprenyl-3-methyl-5-hydroxy-6-metoxy-1,4-benzoquinol methylase
MENCPYCGKSGNLYFLINTRSYYRCLGCDLIFRDITESYDDIVATYRETYFVRHSADLFEERRTTLYDHILDKIIQNRKSGRLLDVGTGCGFFLVAAKERNWGVKGIEPSVQSVEFARQQNGLDVFHGTLNEYDGNGQFDIITFINVLDHSSLPWLEINRASELLRPGGTIYLRFPNGFLHSQLYRMAYKCRLHNSLRKFLVFHVYSLTPKYIKRLLHDHGFIQTTILNSPPSEGDPHRLFPDPNLATYVKKFIYSVAKCTEITSFGRLLLGTSLAVTAVKSDYPQA